MCPSCGIRGKTCWGIFSRNQIWTPIVDVTWLTMISTMLLPPKTRCVTEFTRQRTVLFVMSDVGVMSSILTWPPSAGRCLGGRVEGRRGGDGNLTVMGVTVLLFGGEDTFSEVLALGGEVTLAV